MRRLRGRLTYANVMATIAVFVALGGTTYAAATIGAKDIKDDAVHSNHIKDGAVRNADLAPNSVGGGKVADNSITGKDVAEGQLSRVPNADNIDGIDSSKLQRAGFLHAGTAEQEEGGEGTIIRWNELGVAVNTNDDTVPDTVQFANIRAAGDVVIAAPSSTYQLPPDKHYAFPVGHKATTFLVTTAFGVAPLRTWLVTCAVYDYPVSHPIVCEGIANRPG